jgi:hypothetical protein
MHRGHSFYLVLALVLIGLGLAGNQVKSQSTANAAFGWAVTLELPEPPIAPRQSIKPSALAITGAATAAPNPVCSPGCGEPCWLVASGSLPGTFELSGGKLGLLDCTGLCWDVQTYKENCG